MGQQGLGDRRDGELVSRTEGLSLHLSPGGQVQVRAPMGSGLFLRSEEGPWHRDGFAQREQVRPSPPSGKQVDRSPAPAR